MGINIMGINIAKQFDTSKYITFCEDKEELWHYFIEERFMVDSKIDKIKCLSTVKKEYPICYGLNSFMGFISNRHKRIKSIEKKKGWIGNTDDEVKQFQVEEMIKFFLDNPDYCKADIFRSFVTKLFRNDKYLKIAPDNLQLDPTMLEENFHVAYNAHELKLALEKSINSNSTDYTITISERIDIPLATLGYIFSNNQIIKKCQHCGKIFVPARANELYCNGVSPINTDKSCKDAVKYQNQLIREANNELLHLEKNIYNTLRNRTLARPCIKTDNAYIQLNNYLEEKNRWKDEIKAGKKQTEEYKHWLENYLNKEE